MTAAEPAVWFAPTGSDDRYEIELEVGAASTLRIDVQAPSGLISLGRREAPNHDLTTAIEDYWEAHCRQISP